MLQIGRSLVRSQLVPSTQSLIEMSTRSISWGQRRPVRRADNLPPSCAVITKSGNLNFLEPSGPVQACNWTVLPFKTDTLHQHFPSHTRVSNRRFRRNINILFYRNSQNTKFAKSQPCLSQNTATGATYQGHKETTFQYGHWLHTDPDICFMLTRV